MYSAPPVPALGDSVTVRATSLADLSKSSTATVTFYSPRTTGDYPLMGSCVQPHAADRYEHDHRCLGWRTEAGFERCQRLHPFRRGLVVSKSTRSGGDSSDRGPARHEGLSGKFADGGRLDNGDGIRRLAGLQQASGAGDRGGLRAASVVGRRMYPVPLGRFTTARSCCETSSPT